MYLRSITLIMTEDCNFNCSYCYQKKRKKYLDRATIEKAVDFFLPRLTDECYINFHGGEPLLAFDAIEYTLNYIGEKNSRLDKKINYALVTNGSLLNDNILRIFKQKNFSILLSFDGILQDISRKEGSSRKIVEALKSLVEYPRIELEVSSVFTPYTVGSLSESLRFIMEIGVSDIFLSLSTLDIWDSASLLRLDDELTLLNSHLVSFYEQHGNIPLIFLRKNSGKGIFFCSAGQNRLALAPDGNIWGCYLFPDYFKETEGTEEYNKYCFGKLDSFIDTHENIYPEIIKNYSRLRMSNFYSSQAACIDCSELYDCIVCPIDAALSSLTIGEIPTWTCEIKKLLRKKKKAFWNELND